MAPGVVVSISYIMATGLTALAFILERRDGLFERSLVAGVDTFQILIAHAMTQIIVMVVQILLVLVFTFLVFDIPSRGPFIWVILLLLLQGCTGMAFGKFPEYTFLPSKYQTVFCIKLYPVSNYILYQTVF